jgi:hypothetical protein
MTPKEKIIEILENNSDTLKYYCGVLGEKAEIVMTLRQREAAADDIIRCFAEATGYNLETLIEKEDEIV